MDPFAAGAFTLEHHVAWTVEVWVERPPTEAVNSLIFAITVGIVWQPRLLFLFILLTDKVLHFLRTIDISKY